jgi:ABC-type antimicrobial peptide transport system permease subunit
MVTVILFLALAGLLIAAVNVSNILMSRALRRQKTIGILKALGSSKRMIFTLFFREAFTIGILAALAGIAVSIGLARLMRETTGFAAVNPVMLVAGIGVSWIISSVLTVFPALQASKIPAAEAMRTE